MSCSRSLQSMFIVYILRSVVTSHSTVTLHTLYFLLSLLVLYCLVALIKMFMIVYRAIIYRDFLNAVAFVSHRTSTKLNTQLPHNI